MQRKAHDGIHRSCNWCWRGGEFYREPEAVFWVYVFPLLMTIALGIAFRNQPVERFKVDICSGPAAADVQRLLSAQDRFTVALHDSADCFQRFRTGKTDLVVVPQPQSATRYAYHFDPTKPGSQVARMRWMTRCSAVLDESIRCRCRMYSMRSPADVTSTSSCPVCSAWD